MNSTVITGDALKVLREARFEGSVDIVVTSPPYNLGKKYGEGFSDKLKPAQYLNWVDDWLRLLKVVVVESGSVFLNIGGTPRNQTLPLQVLAVAQTHWTVQNVFHWIKSITMPDGDGGEVTRGHFKPINSNHYVNDTHEYIYHLVHKDPVPIYRKAPGVGTVYSDKTNVRRWQHTGGSDLRCRGNCWFLPYATIQSRDKQRPHPATFPVELAERCIRLACYDGGTVVLDPFMGLGSTGLAAQRCGCAEFIGIDIIGDYVRRAADTLGCNDSLQG